MSVEDGSAGVRDKDSDASAEQRPAVHREGASGACPRCGKDPRPGDRQAGAMVLAALSARSVRRTPRRRCGGYRRPSRGDCEDNRARAR